MVDALVPRGILVRTTEPEGVTLGRSPDTVLVADALEAVREAPGPGPALPGEVTAGLETVLARRDHGARLALAGLTARQLVEPGDPPG